ncbi:Kievitone hydratase [Colletotrichum orbiculare MAFF 240422]|uniref:Kievitone hydratase n=1 Tax=Colletotrichum orbiculare (strain 104-T / ATCC 96160 / CBS 514.97 / LARS 414 / MAFF 240422) TaxID=1213857 RepID=N4V4X0_COLOR|nr:Kievitone hydratase [Colletotrichum orbiculare MAFF 240422]
MKTALLSALGLAAHASAAAYSRSTTGQYDFAPEQDDKFSDDALPYLFDFGQSQGLDYSGSWWTSSYITGTNNVQYLVLSHVLDTPIFSYHRGSVLDLSTLQYTQFVSAGNATLTDTANPRYNVNVGGGGFEALSADNVTSQRTYSTHANGTWDMTWNATSGAVSNVGSGSFQFGPSVTTEWGLPNCYTEGTLIAPNGDSVTVDPARSFTWYDRQWGTAAVTSGNWTWFQLHVPESSDKLSIWIIDSEATGKFNKFATVRGPDGDHGVLPVKWEPKYERSTKSQGAGADILYPLDWTLEIAGYGTVDVASIAADQEIVGGNAIQTAYEGFVNYTGVIGGKNVTGFGLVEIVYANW